MMVQSPYYEPFKGDALNSEQVIKDAGNPHVSNEEMRGAVDKSLHARADMMGSPRVGAQDDVASVNKSIMKSSKLVKDSKTGKKILEHKTSKECFAGGDDGAGSNGSDSTNSADFGDTAEMNKTAKLQSAARGSLILTKRSSDIIKKQMEEEKFDRAIREQMKRKLDAYNSAYAEALRTYSAYADGDAGLKDRADSTMTDRTSDALESVEVDKFRPGASIRIDSSLSPEGTKKELTRKRSRKSIAQAFE